jgi:hypothetical protein
VTPLWAIVVYLVILGCGFGLFSLPNVDAIMGAVERKSYGVASAMLGTVRLVGQTLSMGIATLISALYLGQVAIAPEVYPQFLASLKPAFAVSLSCFAWSVWLRRWRGANCTVQGGRQRTDDRVGAAGGGTVCR